LPTLVPTTVCLFTGDISVPFPIWFAVFQFSLLSFDDSVLQFYITLLNRKWLCLLSEIESYPKEPFGIEIDLTRFRHVQVSHMPLLSPQDSKFCT
jgi:hypothetical protein